MKKTLGVMAAFLLPLVAACSEASPEAEPSDPVTVTVTPWMPTPTPVDVESPEEPSAAPTGPVQPNVGSSALKVGEWREGLQARTIVTQVKKPGEVKAPTYLEASEVEDTLLVMAKTCVRDGADPQFVSPSDFVALDQDSGEYGPAGITWTDWPPRPQYPTREVRPGQCVKGWSLLAVPEATKIVAIAGVADGQMFAEWRR